MEESSTNQPLPSEIPTFEYPVYEPRVAMVLATQIGLFLLGSALGAMVFSGIALALGWDPALTLTADSPEAARWQIRLQLGLGHLFAFCFSGGLTIWMFYRSLTGVKPDWPDYLLSRHAPRPITAGLGILLMMVSVPLVLYSLNLNQLIPLPEFFKGLEDQTAEILKGLLQMEHPGEFWANLAIIALLPAIGEELVFRAVVQKQLMRVIQNPWAAILVAAAIFSFAHFQLEGFLPRMLLGIILGWLYFETQNFWVPVIGHFFNNGIQVFGQYLYGQEISTVDLEQDIQVPLPFAAMSAVMILLVARLIRQSNKQNKGHVS